MNGTLRTRRPLAGLAAAGGLLLASAACAQGTPAEGDRDGAGWTALFRDVRLTFGPARWRGDFASEFRLQRAPDQGTQHGFVESGNVSVASYIYQPWLAQVNANLGLVWSGAGGSGEGRSAALTGGAGLALFPASRFPAEATLTVSDSRASDESDGADFRSVLMALRQSYRMADGAIVAGRLERSTLSGPAIGRDALGVAAATYSGRRGAHALSGDGFWSTNTGSASDTRIRRVAGQHSYAPADNLNFETLASYNWQEVEQKAGPRSALGGRFAQLASFATWRPDEGEPLYDEKHPMMVTGGLRATLVGLETGAASADAVALSGAAGVTYELGPATRLYANGSVTQASGDNGGGFFSALNANAAYDPPPIRRGPYAYSWRLSGGASAATGDDADRQSLFAQANHQVTRDFAVGERSLLALSFGQGLGGLVSTRDENAVTLSHNAQATWTASGGSAAQTYASVGLADARSFGTPRSQFQLANLQLTRQAPIDALSYWSANLTVQGSRQSGEPSVATTTAYDTGFNVSTYGSVSYQHRRVFGVPRLRFTASYTAGQSQFQSRAEGDTQASPRPVTDALDARLEYRIGKLDARLTVRSAAVDGRRNTGIYVRATRYF